VFGPLGQINNYKEYLECEQLTILSMQNMAGDRRESVFVFWWAKIGQG